MPAQNTNKPSRRAGGGQVVDTKAAKELIARRGGFAAACQKEAR